MLHVVIMAGGKGTRFWPLSRSGLAKQYLNVIGKKTLIELTIERLSPLVKPENIWIVTNKSQKKYIKQFAKEIPSKNILYEPVGKNTAPCIGWAAIEIIKKDSLATMIVLPADHFINEKTIFQNAIKAAIKQIEKENSLVTIGIPPTFAHTGYGYIEVKNNNSNVLQVKKFHEKPAKDIAEQYIKKGNFFWNSGMFIWKASKILSLIQKHLPKNYEILQNIYNLEKDKNYQQNIETEFDKFESISIDYGIMEKAYEDTKMIKAEFGWNDIGNWSSLEDFWPKDENNNAAKANLLCVDSKDNIVYSEKRLVSLVDIENLIVVDTPDALLILPKSSDQKIKNLYNKLPKKYL
jgi:mannose-1-phosphate guanylyltransferase